MAKSRQIIALDCETDPFKRNRIPKPFIWGFYDGEEFTYSEDIEYVIDELKARDCIVYAHNGGKFDYHYIFDFLEPFSDILIINGRIAKFTIGAAEFRDSYNIIPTGLRAYQKEDFDYSLLEGQGRYKTENWRKIVAYLESDCRNLYNMVTDFIDRYGLNLTQAGTAMKQWQKIANAKPPKSTKTYYDELSRYYHGGRVQCFKRGVINEKFAVYDINSAYPYAMLHSHPIGTIFHHRNDDISLDAGHYGASFFTVEAKSMGAFPARTDSGALFFPDDGEIRIFNVTGWELQAARETGTDGNVRVLESYEFTEFTDFKDYITHFYNERMAARESGDKAGDLFSKLLMNSLYGKFGSNPDEYENFMVVGQECLPDLDGSKYRFAGELGPFILCGSDLNADEKRFYNVATSASITGFVRAYLWRAIHGCGIGNVLYCDTDSVSTTNGAGLRCGSELGAWKHEGDFDRAGIGGKKLYIFRGVPDKNGKREYKTASKGAKLTHNQLWRIAQGATVVYKPENPTYSVHSGIRFIDRSIRMTY